MSLEQTLEQTNELLKQVITILQTGVSAGAELGTADTTKKSPGRPKKTDTPAAGTVYWLIEKHNTVFAQEPGMAAPTFEGAVQVTKEEYEAKKSQYAALGAQAQATTTAAKPAATSAPSQPTAEVAAADAPAKSIASPAPQPATAPTADASSASEPAFADVMTAAKALNDHGGAGKGRALLMEVLQALLPGVEKPTVAALQALGKNAAVIEAMKAKMAPAEEFDPLA